MFREGIAFAHVAASVLALLLAAACDEGRGSSSDDDDDGSSDSDSDSDVDSDSDSDSDSDGDATISGTITRDASTCPPGPGEWATGNLCLSLRTDCDDEDSSVLEQTTANWPLGVDMWLPYDPEPFEMTGVPDGTFELYVFLDDDLSGCDDGPNTYDFLPSDCASVTVADQEDVTGVSINFLTKCP